MQGTQGCDFHCWHRLWSEVPTHRSGAPQVWQAVAPGNAVVGSAGYPKDPGDKACSQEVRWVESLGGGAQWEALRSRGAPGGVVGPDPSLSSLATRWASLSTIHSHRDVLLAKAKGEQQTEAAEHRLTLKDGEGTRLLLKLAIPGVASR